jgi:hypothetical protein
MRDPESSMAALPPCWKIPAIQEATPLQSRDQGHITIVMKQSKPLSVVWFDRLYWLSFLIFFVDEVVKFFGLINPEARWWLMGAVPNILIGIAVWFFASVRRSHIALIIIATIVAGRIFSFLSIYQIPDFFWASPMLSFFKIAPSLILALALALMMTPSATAWRRRETDYPIEIFE